MLSHHTALLKFKKINRITQVLMMLGWCLIICGSIVFLVTESSLPSLVVMICGLVFMASSAVVYHWGRSCIRRQVGTDRGCQLCGYVSKSGSSRCPECGTTASSASEDSEIPDPHNILRVVCAALVVWTPISAPVLAEGIPSPLPLAAVPGIPSDLATAQSEIWSHLFPSIWRPELSRFNLDDNLNGIGLYSGSTEDGYAFELQVLNLVMADPQGLTANDFLQFKQRLVAGDLSNLEPIPKPRTLSFSV